MTIVPACLARARSIVPARPRDTCAKIGRAIFAGARPRDLRGGTPPTPARDTSPFTVLSLPSTAKILLQEAGDGSASPAFDRPCGGVQVLGRGVPGPLLAVWRVGKEPNTYSYPGWNRWARRWAASAYTPR